MEKRKKCNLCGSSNFKTLLDSLSSDYPQKLPQSFALKKCENCSLVFLDPLPSFQELKVAYHSSYYTQNRDTEYSNKMLYKSVKDKAFYFLRKNPFKLVAKGIERAFSERTYFLKDNGRILDVGCGNGVFLLNTARAAKKKDYTMEFHGIDIVIPKDESLERHDIKFQQDKLTENKYPDNYFDFVTAHHVIEHLPDPKEGFHEIYRILKPGGKTALEVPSIGSLPFKLFGRNWVGIAIPSHLYYFSPSTLKQYAREAGFKVKKIRYVSEPETFLFSMLRCFNLKEKTVERWAKNSFLSILFSPLILLLNFFRVGDVVEIIIEKQS